MTETDLVPTKTLNAALGSDAFTRGTAAASAVTDLAIRSGDDNAIATELGAAMKAALRHLEGERKRATQPINAALAVIRGYFAPHEARINAALKVLDAKQLAFAKAERDRVARETREAQERADAAAAKARADAEVFAEEAPPALVVAPVEVPTITRGSGGVVSFTRKTLKVELVDPHECEPTWLRLDEAKAREWFRDHEAREGLQTPCVVAGVRYTHDEGITRR